MGAHKQYQGYRSYQYLEKDRDYQSFTLAYEEVEYVDGLENPADFPNILRWLVKHGYSDEHITKVMGGNALRVLKQVWVH
jgi:microsomal dipeptidase-like Zn-dependent dipeptidase